MTATETKRWKRGDIGPDGRVFWSYNKTCKNGEHWVTGDKFEKKKARRQTPERKAHDKAYYEAYHQTPEYKAYRKVYLKTYHQTPEYKACWKAYHQTPEYKASQKAYKQTPEYKASQKAYDKARRQTLSQESTARNYMSALMAAQQLSELLSRQTTNDNDNTK
jgi:hypothetical protein